MQDVTKLYDTVMRGVVAAIPHGKTVADYRQAVAVMRSEIKSLLTGAEYADARECVFRGSLNDRYIIWLVVTNCLSKIPLKAAV